MSFNSTPYKSRPPPGQQGSTPFRSSSASKFRSSLVPTSRPSPVRSHKSSSSKLPKTPTGARDLFDTTPRIQRTPQFAPDLPAEVTRLNPRMRKMARKSVSAGMSNITSTEHFQMRIPSPDPGLTGEALTKAIPDDPNRTDSIYADQFLAHKCPPHFDDLQRRQFFCILDLRRLKYAADEIFAKKDWKLNILNFAREFEKSRSLIMLRYGLFEFKTVRPSSEVLQKWRSAHGIDAETEEDGSSNRRTPGRSMKRKADEELTSKDSTFMVSGNSQNKRRNVNQDVDNSIMNGSTPVTGKRKAPIPGDEGELQRIKLPKTTPSAAASIFESIVNKPQNSGTSPLKKMTQPSLFGLPKPKDTPKAGFTTKANPFQQNAGSLLFGSSKTINADGPSTPGANESILSGHKIGSTPVINTGNIFSYLSESPGSSSNDNDDSDEPEANMEPEQGSEEQESEEQGRSAAASTSTSTSTSTPLAQSETQSFNASRKGDAPTIFGGLPKPSNQSAKGGLFARVQMGPDNQPIRASPTPDDKPGSVKEATSIFGKHAATPAKLPGDYTFNPATTPITFGQTSTDVTKTPAAAALGSSVKSTNPKTLEPKQSVSIFGASSQTTPMPKPDASSLFGSSVPTKAKSSETPVSIFASFKPTPASSTPASSTPASSSIFGTTSTSTASTVKKPLGSTEPNAALTGTKADTGSIFDKPGMATPAASDTKPSDDKGVSVALTAKNQTPNIFDKSFIADHGAKTKALSDSLKPIPEFFSRSANPLFRDANANDKNASSTKSDDKGVSGASTAQNQTPNIFDKSFIADHGAKTKALSDSLKPIPDFFSRSANPLFRDANVNDKNTSSTKSVVDQAKEKESPAPVPTANMGNKENLGSSTAFKATTPAVSIFGTQAGSVSAAPTSTPLFGDKKSDVSAHSAPKALFGEQKSDKPAMTSMFGQTMDKSASTSIFGQKSDKPASTSIFGQKTETPAKSASTSIFGQSSGSAVKPVSTSIFGQASGSAAKSASTSIFGQTSDSSSKPTSTIFSNVPAANNSMFSTGSQSFSNTNTQSTSMSFGATPATSVSFGGPSSQPAGGDLKKPDFQFGGSDPSAGSSSFQFGQDSSAGTGFTFTAGTDKGTINNPFATSQPTPQVSAPSSSFSFTFGPQTSCAPQVAPIPQGSSLFSSANHANGAPTISFSQPQPGQNPITFMGSKAPAATSIFGHLHAGGDVLSDGASPFPVPSSIGTTPANGTPEPEAAHEDGEEPRHAQISLTEGGPGEEDEIIVHEVRAKAIKFVPMQKGDEDQDKKSPWSTQGIGPLRILKNKSTGTVRMLLRAEPRGHIALNKAILADMAYTAKEKTVGFAAAKDDGSGLESWALQVKTGNAANELARVLEANKASNKK